MSEELKLVEQAEPCIDCERAQENEPTADELAEMERKQREDALNVLREIALIPSRQVTNQQRIIVKGYAEMYGVELPKNLQCSSCWIDLAARVYKKIKQLHSEPKEESNYKLHEGVDVVWQGVRINAQTLTDELAAKWIASGFPLAYFEKWK